MELGDCPKLDALEAKLQEPVDQVFDVPELLSTIFEYLHTWPNAMSCRSVNKKWKRYMDYYMDIPSKQAWIACLNSMKDKDAIRRMSYSPHGPVSYSGGRPMRKMVYINNGYVETHQIHHIGTARRKTSYGGIVEVESQPVTVCKRVAIPLKAPILDDKSPHTKRDMWLSVKYDMKKMELFLTPCFDGADVEEVKLPIPKPVPKLKGYTIFKRDGRFVVI